MSEFSTDVSLRIMVDGSGSLESGTVTQCSQFSIRLRSVILHMELNRYTGLGRHVHDILQLCIGCSPDLIRDRIMRAADLTKSNGLALCNEVKGELT